MFELKRVCKEYQSGNKTIRALDDVNLSFPSVQFASILGPSGCGKSTLLNLLGGLDNVTSGDILFDGLSLPKMNEERLNKFRNEEVGFIFQNYILIPQLSVIENVETGLAIRGYNRAETEKLAKEALEWVGISDLAEKKPNQLSGGQAQKAAIARALVTNPSIILADEPTGALDSKSSASIMKILKEISKTKLVIMVTHNEVLAKEYSDRIIRINDGKIEKDETINKTEDKKKTKTNVVGKGHMSFGMKMRLAGLNIMSKKVKTIVSCLANSLSLIGIGFFLAINTGFTNYSARISESTASSFPVVVTAYDSKTSSEQNLTRQSENEYPEGTEIYPNVSSSSSVSYQCNNFTQKYFDYLDSLVTGGFASEYTVNYGNNYAYNLMTDFPASLDGKSASYINRVTTSYTYGSDYYARQSQLPTSIFHVLYGDMTQYDVLAGSLPEDSSQLMLVVDSYNGVDFRTLKELGFYNKNDTQQDVKESVSGDSTKFTVKPITFSDIIGKEYKVFNNDDFYEVSDSKTITDASNTKREMTEYGVKDDVYINDNLGVKVKISCIVRPKKTSTYTLLSPSLCYLPELQNNLRLKNSTSSLNETLRNNVRMIDPNGTGTAVDDFTSEVTAIYNEYKATITTGGTLPTDKINTVFDKYFRYQCFWDLTTTYTSLSSFRYHAGYLGVDLVPDALKGKDLSADGALDDIFSEFQALYLTNRKDAFNLLLGVNAYLNAYGTISSVVIFPVNIENRETLMKKLDEFNVIGTGSDHASSSIEQVFYSADNSIGMLEDVGHMVSLVSVILSIYVCVTLIVSCIMMSLMTSNNVLERRTEIGLLRSLGARKRDVATLFESESLGIGIVSGVLGSLLTWGLSYPVNNLINSFYSYYKVGTICNFTWYHSLILVGISIIICILASLIPSLKASSEKPVECLRKDE